MVFQYRFLLAKSLSSHYSRIGRLAEHGRPGLVLGALLSLMPSFATSTLPGVLPPIQNVQSRDTVRTPERADQQAPNLERGRPIAGELAGGQAQSYSVALRAGYYVHIVVEQHGIDVVVTLFGPDGRALTEVDSPNGTEGPEPLYFLTRHSGRYQLQVRSLEKTAAPGRYLARIDELRRAQVQDSSRIAATNLFREAQDLQAAGTGDALRNAISRYQESLVPFRRVGDRESEATALNIIAGIHDQLGEKEKALGFYAQALSVRRALGDRRGEAMVLNNIGKVYDDSGAYQKALDFYTQALALKQAGGDRLGEATTLNNIGNVYQGLGQLQKALDFQNRALLLYRAAGDSDGQATALANVGSVYGDLGEKQKALDYYTQAVELFRALGNRRNEAVILNNIGGIYSDIGEKQKALDFYSQALPLRRALADGGGEATTLHNVGRVYADLGQQQKALEFYGQALAMFRDIGARLNAARVLNSIGVANEALAEYQKALDSYSLALPLLHAIGARRSEGITLVNIGLLYGVLGDYHKALAAADTARHLFHDIGDSSGEGHALTIIGGISDESGDKQNALNAYVSALSLLRAAGDRAGEASALDDIGWVYHDLGREDDALASLTQARLLFHAVGDPDGEASSLVGIGSARASLGDTAAALESLTAGLSEFRAVMDLRGQARALFHLAQARQKFGNPDGSIANVESSLALLDTLRTRVGSQRLRASYFASVRDSYEFYIDLLMDLHSLRPSQGYDGKALEANERSRARSLLETLTETRADIREGVDTTLLQNERMLQQQLNSNALQQTRLLASTHTTEQATALAESVEVLTTRLEETEAAIRARSPRYAALTQPTPVGLERIQQELDGGSLLLEYSLGTHRSSLWAVTPTSIAVHVLPQRSEIEVAARRYYELLNTPMNILARPGEGRSSPGDAEGEMLQAATRVSRLLLGPVAGELGHKRLVVVADGVLQYLSFAALPDPATLRAGAVGIQPLIVRHEIVYSPSMSVVATMREDLRGRSPARATLAVFADPVFSANDERVRQRPGATVHDTQPGLLSDVREAVDRSAEETGARRDGTEIARLMGTRREAEGILALVPGSEAERALDFEATRDLATSRTLGEYRYVHFATHGLLNNVHPELSGIVLSLVDSVGRPLDGFLRAHDVYNLRLPAEVVTLSGCQTGLGQEVKGEGLIGLTRGFLYAGAARVVVSLWKVDDDATAQLMVRFYRGMLREGKRPAEALRAAQIAMWRTNKWQAPYYWAAFVLQGEWR